MEQLNEISSNATSHIINGIRRKLKSRTSGNILSESTKSVEMCRHSTCMLPSDILLQENIEPQRKRQKLEEAKKIKRKIKKYKSKFSRTTTVVASKPICEDLVDDQVDMCIVKEATEVVKILIDKPKESEDAVTIHVIDEPIQTKITENDKILNSGSDGESECEIIYENTQIKRAIDSITGYDEEQKTQSENQNLKRIKWDSARLIRKIPRIPKKVKYHNNEDVDTEAMKAVLNLERIMNGEIEDEESSNEQMAVCFPELNKLDKSKRRTKKFKQGNKDEGESICDFAEENTQSLKEMDTVKIDKEPKVDQHLSSENKTKIPRGANPTPETSPWYYSSRIRIKLPNLAKKPGPLYGLKPTIATNLGVDLSFLTDEFVNDALKMMVNESQVSKRKPEIGSLQNF